MTLAKPETPIETRDLDAEPAAQTHVDPVLTPKLSDRWALAPWQVSLIAAWAIFYVALSYVPLRGTDLWAHVIYGDWILEHGRLPTEDPVMPLAQGMRVVDGAWLSQVIFALVEKGGGPEWLTCLFALTSLATYLVLAAAYQRRTDRLAAALTALVIAGIVGWSRLTTIRPENFGALCFAGLLFMIVRSGLDGQPSESKPPSRSLPWWIWLGIPLVMALWANLHGSFACGLIGLGCFFAGALIESAIRNRDLRAVLDDPSVRQWLLVCELGLLGALCNPYGMDLLVETLVFSRNENLRDVLEWQPLVILGVGGIEFGLSWVLLTIVLRQSRARMPMSHVLLLGVFAVSAVFGVRMLTWYAMVYGYVLAPHLADLAARYLPVAAMESVPELGRASPSPAASQNHHDGEAEPGSEEDSDEEEAGEPLLPMGPSWKYSLIAGLILWMAFTFSPLSYAMFGSKSPRGMQQVLGKSTPLECTNWLRENAPRGQIFNPQWYGDWLAWDGPKGLKPFMTTNMHLAPRRVWQDYMAILTARADWRLMLDKYRVDTLVLDKTQQENLTSLLRLQTDWRIAHEDEVAVVYTRSRPAPAKRVTDDSGKPPAQSKNGGAEEPASVNAEPASVDTSEEKTPGNRQPEAKDAPQDTETNEGNAAFRPSGAKEAAPTR